MINKDTKIYGSFSSNPGNNGCLFFNEAFKRYGINAIYKSFYSQNIEDTIQAVKHLKFSGFALSMPLKHDIINKLDFLDDAVSEISSCNTVVIEDGKLTGFNTDWIAIYKFFQNSKFNQVNIIGTGCFSRSIKYAFDKLGISYNIYSRGDINKIDEVQNQIFINATPSEIVSIYNTIIDGRPHTEDGRKISILQAKEQFKIYTGIEYD